jgi:membrane protein required for colicin V production
VLNFALFTWLDWLIVAAVGASTLLSLGRGFVREAVSLAGWVAAFIGANLFAATLSQLLAPYIENESGRYVAAYVIVFIAVLIVANICGFLLKQLVRMTGLTVLDRILGTVFGFARGVLLVLVVVMLARELVAPEQLRWMRDSQLMPTVELLIQWVSTVFGRLELTWVPGTVT